MDAKELAKKLQHELEFHRRQYYELEAPVITDPEYDALYNKFLEYKEMFPDLEDHVGWKPIRNNIKHVHPMLSLKSTKDLMNILAFFSKIKDEVSGEPKVDGLSVELVYRDNHLTSASTRGDGAVGEDITLNVMEIDTIPKEISEGYDIEIYGEIYLCKDKFHEINTHRIRSGSSVYSNPRNAASGIARSIKVSPFIKYLNFFPYTIHGTVAPTQTWAFSWLQRNGFDTLDDLRCIISNTDDYRTYLNTMTSLRKDIPFEIDGLVFKNNNIEIRDEIGIGRTHPNWAVAFKFESERKTTRVSGVKFNVGKSGIIAPVAVLEEVVLMKRRITKASLANKTHIQVKDIRIDDVVVVELANDVIPAVIEVVVEERTGKEIPIVFPTHCPVCGHKLSEIGTESIITVCTNPYCAGQILGRLASALGRKGFNVKGIGKVMLVQLIESDVIKNLADVFDLEDRIPLGEISRIIGRGEVVTQNLLNGIKLARKVPLHKFILALGIPDVGVVTSCKLAEYYRDLATLIDSIQDQGVVSLSHTDSKTLGQINSYFRDERSIDQINRMIGLGVETISNDTKLSKKIVITGTCSRPRDELVEMLRVKGYQVGNVVSKNTSFVIRGEGKVTKDKLDKAEKLNIPILTEDEMIDRLNRE